MIFTACSNNLNRSFSSSSFLSAKIGGQLRGNRCEGIMELSRLLIVHIVFAAVVLLLTVLGSFQSLRKQSLDVKKEVYKDKDGEATQESQKKYSIKWQNILATIFGVAGFAIALTNAVLSILQESSTSVEAWLQVGLWVSD